MPNLFQRTQDQVRRKQEQVNAIRNADPNKVTRIPNGRINPLELNDYEKGVIDGMEGVKRKVPGVMGQERFTAYARGYEAGERNRLKNAKAASKTRYVVPQRPIPSAEQVAAELAEREALDTARREARQRNGILQELSY
jgi:hypothetical protein